MSTITTIARTAATTLVVLGLSAGIAVANPCETDAAFAAANCETDATNDHPYGYDDALRDGRVFRPLPSARVLSASVGAPSPAGTMVSGLGLLVR